MLLALLSGVLELGYAPEIFKSIVSSWRVPIALLPNFFVVVIPIFYSLLFIADMRVAWKEDARTTYRGPTHISLSPLSIKLLWKGAIIVSVGAMFGWDEITFVELDLPESESDESAPTVILTIKTGRLVHTIPFRLDGFQSDEDRLIFLHHIDNHVASECKTAQFKEFLSAKDKTELLLNKLKEQTTGDSIELTEELSAPGISVQTANLAGLISDKSTIEQNAQAERIIVTPTKMEAPIPRTSNEHSANSPELIAFDRSPEDTR
jgi:hypothetical protein